MKEGIDVLNQLLQCKQLHDMVWNPALDEFIQIEHLCAYQKTSENPGKTEINLDSTRCCDLGRGDIY